MKYNFEQQQQQHLHNITTAMDALLSPITKLLYNAGLYTPCYFSRGILSIHIFLIAAYRTFPVPGSLDGMVQPMARRHRVEKANPPRVLRVGEEIRSVPRSLFCHYSQSPSHGTHGNVVWQIGSLVRVGPNVLITTDVELMRRMNAARSPYTRSDWYLAFRIAPGADNVISMRDDNAHTRRRAQLTNGVLFQRPLMIYCLLTGGFFVVGSTWERKT
jgi:hypothetical protein